MRLALHRDGIRFIPPGFVGAMVDNRAFDEDRHRRVRPPEKILGSVAGLQRNARLREARSPCAKARSVVDARQLVARDPAGPVDQPLPGVNHFVAEDDPDRLADAPWIERRRDEHRAERNLLHAWIAAERIEPADAGAPGGRLRAENDGKGGKGTEEKAFVEVGEDLGDRVFCGAVKEGVIRRGHGLSLSGEDVEPGALRRKSRKGGEPCLAGNFGVSSGGADGGAISSCEANREKIEMNARPMATITPAAVRRIATLAGEGGLRIDLRKGGCAGMEYAVEIVPAMQPGDLAVEQDGVRMFLAARAQLFLVGAEIDHVSTLLEHGFRIRNPNERASCGCGTSVGF